MTYKVTSLIPRLPLFHTASDGKLGGAWEWGYKFTCCAWTITPCHKTSLMLHRESPVACHLSTHSYVVCLIAKLISLDSAHGKYVMLWLVSMVTESVKGVRWFFVCKLQSLPTGNSIGSSLVGSVIVCGVCVCGGVMWGGVCGCECGGVGAMRCECAGCGT